ncbi:MAG: hypothetical protein KDK08_25530, partial [Rhizobiaceae bacterium]|nr:hypothetical protein [Rhizobiaceae bacterium]
RGSCGCPAHMLEDASGVAADQSDWLRLADLPLNIFLSKAERKLRDKAFSQPLAVADLFKVNVGVKPYQVGKGKPAQTAQVVKDRIFDANTKSGKEYRQYLRGKDFNRYEIRPLERRYIKYGPWLAEPRPAANFDAEKKLLVRQTGDEIIAALDTEQHLCLNNVHVLEPRDESVDVYAILAILNSALSTWCLRSMNPEAGEALAEVKKEFVEMLPIPPRSTWAQLSKLGRAITALKAAVPSVVRDRQLRALIKQIDLAVFQAFGLTETEIAHVVGSDH